MNLPEKFVESLRRLLGNDEYEKFEASFDFQRTSGIRANTLKMDVSDFCKLSSFPRDSVSWSRDGFYISSEDVPGKHPYYHAGLYYIQDPSAMLPAEMLNPQPGEWVLDLCAAPGGKTVQIAAMMKNTGFLLANDISPKRVKPLRRNLENAGVANAIVTYESPEFLSTQFEGKFDKVLVDAPCSGEGMFRKDVSARAAWNRHNPLEVQQVQRSIIQSAWEMVKPGGTMVYSTCTFNPEENEHNIHWALHMFSDMSVVESDVASNDLQSGRPEWVNGDESIAYAKRIWPHLSNAEGHFAVCLQKADANVNMNEQQDFKHNMSVKKKSLENAATSVKLAINQNGQAYIDKKKKRSSVLPANQILQKAQSELLRVAVEAWLSFMQSELQSSAYIIGSNNRMINFSSFLLHGTMLYVSPTIISVDSGSSEQADSKKLKNVSPVGFKIEYDTNIHLNIQNAITMNHVKGHTNDRDSNHTGALSIEKLRLEMPGLCLGEITNGRFEPASSLLHALNPEAAIHQWNLDAKMDENLIRSYLHGETLMHEGEKGWLAILVDGYPLGWAKQENGFVKNKYPKSWRMQ